MAEIPRSVEKAIGDLYAITRNGFVDFLEKTPDRVYPDLAKRHHKEAENARKKLKRMENVAKDGEYLSELNSVLKRYPLYSLLKSYKGALRPFRRTQRSLIP